VQGEESRLEETTEDAPKGICGAPLDLHFQVHRVVLKVGEIPHPKQAWRILLFATVIFASLSLPPLNARAWVVAVVRAIRLALFAAATAI
jgi:hypothetical protein